MKLLTVTRLGGPEVLVLRDAPDPSCAEGQVRIRVERSGLNFSDVAARVGLYPDAPKPPMTTGYEVSGVVDAVGKGVSLTLGTRVFALTHFGGHATHVVVPESFAHAIPDAMSFDEAAALPVNYLTAFHMLFRIFNLRPGQHVLVHMAAGGVGLAVIELARTVKDVTLYGTASAGKHDFLRRAGVQHPIDYRTQDYSEEVRRLTQGRGVHLVLDPLGGPDWRKGYELLRPTGHLIAFGWSNMVTGPKRNFLHVGRQFLRLPRFSPLKLMGANRSISGVNVGHLWEEAEVLGEALGGVLALYAQGKIHPRVDKVFSLADGAGAHRYVQERQNVGKVLFDCSDATLGNSARK